MKNLKNTKVLITGIEGFTGTHLQEYLSKQGFDVYGTTLSSSKNEKHFQCDITKKDQVDRVISTLRPDYVIHVAAISFVGESDASLIYNVNAIGTDNILHSLLDYNVNPKKIIIASSAIVYGEQGVEVLDESMCPKPVNHYGASKLAMENMAKNYFNKLNIIITRPFNYIGVGQAEHFLIPKIISHYKEEKKEIELGNLDVAREFNDIDYVVDIYHKLLQSEAKSLVLNVSSNKPIKLLDVISIMNEISGYNIRVKVNPAFVRKNEIKTLSGSIELLKKTVSISNAYELKQTLQTMYKS